MIFINSDNSISVQMKFITFLSFFIFLGISSFSCQSQTTIDVDNIPYIYNSDHALLRMRFKILYSDVRDHFKLTLDFKEEIESFGQEKYESLKPLILEKDIPFIQKMIDEGKLTYKDLVTFYIYRIQQIEGNKDIALNSIISLSKDAIKEAEKRDREKKKKRKHMIYGMPILLKDNIGYDGLPTTAGAVILKDNRTKDAYIVKKLKEHGAIILGKTNLSEWAYYFCNGCPLGYSAVGGQSLNPYGRMLFETGGSSSGSGTAIAANLAVAAVGTETSGSILSPSSLNSITGLKPTVGLLSRSGIVPISSTLDTPGPMTKNVTDNAILLDALTGFDPSDSASLKTSGNKNYTKALKLVDLKNKRIGVFSYLLENKSYNNLINLLESNGAKVIIMDAPNPQLNGFLSILNQDIKHDLPVYIKEYAKEIRNISSLADIIAYNEKDMALRAPYGQALFQSAMSDTTSASELSKIKSDLEHIGKKYFNQLFDEHNLDLVLSINNVHAGVAAVAKYPCLTLPMGYKENGEPNGITLILPSLQERRLLSFGYTLESLLKSRKTPSTPYR